jgi:peptidoglycan hydrolase CwlO-like protein
MGMGTKSTQELLSAVVDGHDQLIARMYLAAALIAEGAKVEAAFSEAKSRLAQTKADLAKVQAEVDELRAQVEPLREEQARLASVINQAKENLAEKIKEEAA